MNKLVEDFIATMEQEDRTQRDYRYRRHQEKREQRNRERVSRIGYFPSVPRRKIGEDGSVYYLQGAQAPCKKFLKRAASKTVRTAPLENIANGGHYKKVYNLTWNWF